MLVAVADRNRMHVWNYAPDATVIDVKDFDRFRRLYPAPMQKLDPVWLYKVVVEIWHEGRKRRRASYHRFAASFRLAPGVYTPPRILFEGIYDYEHRVVASYFSVHSLGMLNGWNILDLSRLPSRVTLEDLEKLYMDTRRVNLDEIAELITRYINFLRTVQVYKTSYILVVRDASIYPDDLFKKVKCDKYTIVSPARPSNMFDIRLYPVDVTVTSEDANRIRRCIKENFFANKEENNENEDDYEYDEYDPGPRWWDEDSPCCCDEDW